MNKVTDVIIHFMTLIVNSSRMNCQRCQGLTTLSKIMPEGMLRTFVHVHAVNASASVFLCIIECTVCLLVNCVFLSGILLTWVHALVMYGTFGSMF